MAYYNNNGYPMMFQPQAYQAQGMQAQGSQQAGLIWVQGEAAAKSYLVAPGSTVQLWDSEEKVIYLKSADPSGMPSMKILDYTIRGEAEAKPTEYATKEDLAVLSERIEKMKAELAKKKTVRVIEEAADDE